MITASLVLACFSICISVFAILQINGIIKVTKKNDPYKEYRTREGLLSSKKQGEFK